MEKHAPASRHRVLTTLRGTLGGLKPARARGLSSREQEWLGQRSRASKVSAPCRESSGRGASVGGAAALASAKGRPRPCGRALLDE
eukprot:4535629-Prymnesium_polylepis.2